ncbi:response regulator [Jidongwangia harbinensis]|uniref:response regulator n=1 Tax=Jidongwangia harbinensis TaxID=2878561 RepID=UPI001CD959BB|nr:response regulator [Jidongwangia harbinensis]MCA2211762.1 response regulator [Jidongwangia harbinensis]
MTLLLIAEDDPDVSFTLERIFLRAGCTVLTASDGVAALEIAVQHRPGVILTDLDMPRMTGLELCREIRGHADLHRTPVAIVSGSLIPGDPRAAEAGLCAVVPKPFARDVLVGAVQHLADAGPHSHTAGSAECPLRTGALPG